MQTSECDRETAEVRALFEKLTCSLLASRGRVLVEAREPHFVTAIDGAAARILQVSSSRMCGRRAKAIANAAEEQRRLEEALRCAKTHTRSLYLSITSPAGRRVPTAVQQCEGTNGQIEISLLLAETSPPLLNRKLIVDRRDEPWSQALLQGNLPFNELKVEVDIQNLHDGIEGLKDVMQVEAGLGLGAAEHHVKNRALEIDPDPRSGDSSATLS